MPTFSSPQNPGKSEAWGRVAGLCESRNGLSCRH
ncbi:Rsl1 [Phodopus roborovskii]|uniref:Rsl1 protein n=1 Tax=Phodopus roborovskii TaxID=109678 RepID=A0AAU9ZJ30_PHORO|nr:Rsl1 [Phodopus roborovskii]